MNVFIDCKCKQCGEFVQIWFDDDSEVLHEIKCEKCGAKLSVREIQWIKQSCDMLLVMKQRVKTFRLGEINFVGRQADKSHQ